MNSKLSSHMPNLRSYSCDTKSKSDFRNSVIPGPATTTRSTRGQQPEGNNNRMRTIGHQLLTSALSRYARWKSSTQLLKTDFGSAYRPNNSVEAQKHCDPTHAFASDCETAVPLLAPHEADALDDWLAWLPRHRKLPEAGATRLSDTSSSRLCCAIGSARLEQA